MNYELLHFAWSETTWFLTCRLSTGFHAGLPSSWPLPQRTFHLKGCVWGMDACVLWGSLDNVYSSSHMHHHPHIKNSANEKYGHDGSSSGVFSAVCFPTPQNDPSPSIFRICRHTCILGAHACVDRRRFDGYVFIAISTVPSVACTLLLAGGYGL